MINYVFIPHLQQVPQWKQCYYDHTTLYNMLTYLHKCMNIHTSLNTTTTTTNNKYIGNLYQRQESLTSMQAEQQDQQNKGNNKYGSQISLNNGKISKQITTLQQCRDGIKNIIGCWFNLFVKYSDHQIQICYMFAQLKTFQIYDKYVIYQNLIKNIRHIKQARNNVILLFENLYVEGHYLQKAMAYNLSYQKSIFHILQKLSKNNNMQQQLYYQPKTRLKGLKNRNKKLIDTIQLNCSKYHHQINQSSTQNLKKSANDQENQISSNQILGIGIVMGGLSLLIGMLVVLLQVSQVTLDTNKTFKIHFPVWRGASYLIFFMWVLGVSILFYEKAQINYNLIFNAGEYTMPHSRSIFMKASIFSLIYFVLFILYVMEFTGHMKTSFQYYGELFWALILGYIFIPISFIGSKATFLKLLFKVLISPCFELNFLFVWITEQMISCNQPMGDFFYTVCFVSLKDSTFCSKNSSFFSSAYVMTLYCYRIIANGRVFHKMIMAKPDKKYDFTLGPFLSIMRSAMSLLTSSAALLNKQKVFENALYLWIVFATITTLYSWIIDLKGDWGFLDLKAKRILRQKLIFPKAKAVYYIVAILNLALRTAWVLSLSPFMINSQGFSPFLFTMMISYLQIFRRGVWNVLKVENQHIKNCAQFQATNKDDHILQQVKQQSQQVKQIKKQKKQMLDCTMIQLNVDKAIKQVQINRTKQQQSLSKTRKTEQLNNFKARLALRKQLKKQMKQKQIEIQAQLLRIIKIMKQNGMEYVDNKEQQI